MDGLAARQSLCVRQRVEDVVEWETAERMGLEDGTRG